MPPAPLLEIRSLSVHFGTQAAVHNVSFRVGQAETLGLVGESGSGKSATSLAIMRLLSPTARVTGEIRFGGVELNLLSPEGMRRKRGKEIAMIFQEPMTALNPAMTIGAQITEAIQVHHPELSQQHLRERAIEALNEVALPRAGRRFGEYPHQFSGGQRQRIVIAMALANRPRLLIADEPTTALDATVQVQILDLLQTLRERHRLAMLFVSHDLGVVAGIADRVAVMRHGRIVEEGPTQNLFEAAADPYSRNLFASAPTMHTDRSKPLATLSGTNQ